MHLFGVIMNLFLDMMTIIRCYTKKKFDLGVLVLLLVRIEFEENFPF